MDDQKAEMETPRQTSTLDVLSEMQQRLSNARSGIAQERCSRHGEIFSARCTVAGNRRAAASEVRRFHRATVAVTEHKYGRVQSTSN